MHALIRAFHRAASRVPAYQTLLAEHGVLPHHVVDAGAFSRLCPLLRKANTFDRFSIDQLCVAGTPTNLAGVLTSSGHGGRFSFGLIDRAQDAASADAMDLALDAAFEIASRTTLAINCLPMGVSFSSRRMTVATTSVREDMAVALIKAFGHRYEQILLVGDPLFMKKLVDYAHAEGLDWSQYRVQVVIGEEVFGEHFRGYLAQNLGVKLDQPESGYIMSSFGVGELGLHLCYETPATIALRRAAFRNPEVAQDLFGSGEPGRTLPMILSFNPVRTFIEVVEPDRTGFGQMTISMLDDELPLPLLRYQTGDAIRLLDASAVMDVVRRHRIDLPAALPAALLALKGRDKESLPNGSHVGFYKDVLYADPMVARDVTGAFRLMFSDLACTMHVQLTSAATPDAALEERILRAMPCPARPVRLVLWPYAQFPFGMSLDYERKFTHYIPGQELSTHS